MYKHILTYLVVVCLISTAAAQKDSKIALKHNNAITFFPFTAFNILNPALQAGYQRNLSSKLLLNVDAGIILKHSIFGFAGLRLTSNSVNYSYSGYKLQVGLRRIFSNQCFIGGEVYYLKNTGNINNNYFNSAGKMYEDFFIQERHRYGINAKLGTQFIMHRFLLEWSFGLGFSYNVARHYNRINLEDKAVSSLYAYLFKHGDYIRIHLPINFSVGYKF